MADTTNLPKEKDITGSPEIHLDPFAEPRPLSKTQETLQPVNAETKTGDLISGMNFIDSNGRPVWGTYGVSGELPGGIDTALVENFTIEGDKLNFLKSQSPEIPAEQLSSLTHLRGWKIKEAPGLSPEIKASESQPIVPPVSPELVQPDRGIAFSPQPTPENPVVASVPKDNLAALANRGITQGRSVEALMNAIKTSALHPAEQSAAAAQAIKDHNATGDRGELQKAG